MYLSAWTDNWVDLPINSELFYEKLMEQVEKSTFHKAPVSQKALDVSGTH